MAVTSFVKRIINVSIQLANDPQTGQPATFAGRGGSAITISGARTVVRAENAGSPSSPAARISIFGLRQELMNQLQTLGPQYDQVLANSITVTAGDADGTMSTVHSGTIMNAYADYNAAPNVPMIFMSQTNGKDAVVPADATEFTGTIDVATAMAGFAKQMSLGFENNGIQIKLPSQTFRGSLWQQVQALATAAHIEVANVNGNLCIWPFAGYRTSQSDVPVISKETGMIGYPTFWQQDGMIVRTLFNPKINYGALVEIKTSIGLIGGKDLTKGGRYVVQKLDLALDSLQPNGLWEASLYCYVPGQVPPSSP